jgi:hypothetical protein
VKLPGENVENNVKNSNRKISGTPDQDDTRHPLGSDLTTLNSNYTTVATTLTSESGAYFCSLVKPEETRSAR